MIYFVFAIVSCLALSIANNTTLVAGKRTVRFEIGYLITTVIFTLLTGARAFSIGTDTMNYVYSAKAIQNSYSSIREIFTGYYVEPGYGMLEFLCMRIFGDVHALFAIEGLILLSGLFSFIKSFEGKISKPFAFLVFFTFYYGTSLNISRQYIAVGIGLFAAKYLLNNKPWKYFLCCVISMLFHATGILLFGSYLIWKFVGSVDDSKKVKRRIVLLAVIVIGLCLFIQPLSTVLVRFGLLSTKYSSMLITGKESAASVISIIPSLPLLVLIIFLFKDLIEYDERNRMAITMYIFGFFISLVNIVFGNIGRLSAYWTCWQIILYPECIKLLCRRQSSPESRILIKTFFVIFFFSYWYYSIVYRGFGNVYPYISDIYSWMNW